MASIPSAGDRAAFERLIGELRPKLHRYCARITGSVIDGEDVLQEALAKAVEAFTRGGRIAQPQGWLFRIADNEAIDFLRRRAWHDAIKAEEDPDMMVDPEPTPDERVAGAARLSTVGRVLVGQDGMDLVVTI